jgi:UDP-glucuronate 4-epimerase
MKILVTGSAGFIGNALSLRLLQRGDEVIGVDNLNDYYSPSLKRGRLARTETYPAFQQHQIALEDRDAINQLFQQQRPDRVVNLAAQAGVRYSIENPHACIDSNIVGFMNILEACRNYPVQHLVFASSSSVYGGNSKLPFSVNDTVDHPLSLYAASKKTNELMAHTYAHLFQVACTGLRFFTVYGPWGRPDMALSKFTQKILAGEAIDVYNYGKHQRDFTYIDDIIEGVMRVLDQAPEANPDYNAASAEPSRSHAPYRIYNIGNQQPTELIRYIEVLEDCLGQKSERNLLPMQPGDVLDTHADVEDLVTDFAYKPDTPIELGIENFVRWYREYYQT